MYYYISMMGAFSFFDKQIFVPDLSLEPPTNPSLKAQSQHLLRVNPFLKL